MKSGLLRNPLSVLLQVVQQLENPFTVIAQDADLDALAELLEGKTKASPKKNTGKGAATKWVVKEKKIAKGQPKKNNRKGAAAKSVVASMTIR